MGNKEDIELREQGGTGTPNKKSPHEREGVGSDQRPQGTGATKVEEAFNQTNLGSAKGGYHV